MGWLANSLSKFKHYLYNTLFFLYICAITGTKILKTSFSIDFSALNLLRTMHKCLYVFAFSLLSLGSATAQISNINPTPQQVNSLGDFCTAPTTWRITCDKTRHQSSAAFRALQENGIQVDNKSNFRLTLGIVGDKSVRKFAHLVPQKAEAYHITIGKNGAVIAARDERGLYYGVQSLNAMLSRGKLETATITDWPDVPFRGAIEGFYGRPWSHEHRLRQIDFYGRNKMNVYIYGPKDDPYHRDKWREAYPSEEARRIQELNQRAHERAVNFYWALHPGVDIKWNQEDRDNIVRKLEQMYALGIRSFAIFFDDIWGEGAKGENQADLLNYVDSVFVKKHGDIAPLLLCPTEYNRSWSSDNSVYLAALGNKLNKGIEIMWTGNTVVHTIEKEGMDWINQRIKRKGYIWFNFPVNDFVRDHLLLGPTYGNGLDIANDVSGFVSNPMQYAESSKIALYSIADYTWNMKNYRWDSSWNRALQNLLPSDSAALKVFASYNEDLGPNGHGFRRDESRHLKALSERIRASLKTAPSNTDLQALDQECIALMRACDLLLVNQENPWLIDELRPWLVQGRLVAQYGRLAVAVAQNQPNKPNKAFDDFITLHRQAKALRRQMYENETDTKQLHVYQTGTKLATLRLMPLLDELFAYSTAAYNQKYGTQLDNIAAYTPYRIVSNVPQLKQQPISMSGNEVKVTPSNEVIKWPIDAHFTIEADKVVTLHGMDFNFGVNEIAHKFRLECLLADGTWRTVSLLHYKPTDPVIHTGNELGGMQVKAIRVTNVSGAEVQAYFKSFKFNK